MIWSEFYTDAWFVFDGVHVPPRIQKSMFLLYKVLAKNLIVIFSNKSRWGRISGVTLAKWIPSFLEEFLGIPKNSQLCKSAFIK